ncbi:scavenger receptor cysteine-rich domain-containing protein DMBT1-like [Eudromia elegans]
MTQHNRVRWALLEQDRVQAQEERSEVRLVNGSGHCSGRVEVLHEERWGSVCDDKWGLEEARVVCQEVGCGRPLSAPGSARFGQGSGPIWLDDVNCVGTEGALSTCSSKAWGEHNCNHGEDAGVVCSERSEVRLVNGSGRCSGRVEVLHEERWGSVCDDKWGLEEARVVCQEVGCGRPLSAPGSARFGQGSGPIWLDDVNCVGTEGALSTCSSKAWGEHNCNHGEDAGVVCSERSEVRLVNGSGRCSGRVEVLHEERWGSVCDDEWGLEEARVVCQEVGCGRPLSAPGSARFGQGSGPIWLDDLNCVGTEEALSTCSSKAWGEHNCNHGEDAGVVCSVVELFETIVFMFRSSQKEVNKKLSLVQQCVELVIPSQEGRTGARDDPEGARRKDVLRLVKGPTNCAGRIEILHNGEWGTVCDDGWGLEEARVVCQEVGCGRPQSAPGSAHFGQGSGPIWLDDLNCVGTEEALSTCSSKAWGEHNCNHGEDAGVVCSGKSEVRLVNGSGRCSGRVEVLHEERWGSVCDDEWGLEEARVVCQEVGCGRPLSAPGSARFGQGSGPIWLDDVNCVGTEEALSTCSSKAWGEHNCNHGEDAGVVCSGKVGWVKASS